VYAPGLVDNVKTVVYQTGPLASTPPADTLRAMIIAIDGLDSVGHAIWLMPRYSSKMPKPH
jgi:hypothetical protein